MNKINRAINRKRKLKPLEFLIAKPESLKEFTGIPNSLLKQNNKKPSD